MNIAEQLEDNTASFLSILKGIPKTTFFTTPSPNAWSIAEITEHLIRSEFGMDKLFMGTTQESDMDRDSDAIIQAMQDKLLDRSKKANSPKILLPQAVAKSKEELIHEFSSIRNTLLSNIKAQHKQALCMKYPHLLFGYLTREEWVFSCIYHCQRHLLQVKEVLNHINN